MICFVVDCECEWLVFVFVLYWDFIVGFNGGLCFEVKFVCVDGMCVVFGCDFDD